MKKIHFALAIAASALFVTSCTDKSKDDETVTPKAKTKTELITAGKWQMSAATLTMNDNGVDTTYDFFADMEACEKDDFMTFGTDGNGSEDEGATKCDPADDQTTSGKWSFYDNETKLIITVDGDADTADIVELTESTLKLKYSEPALEMSSMLTYKRI